MTSIANAFRIDGGSPTQFGADGDLAQSLGFAGEQAWREILVDHEGRSTKPARGQFDLSGQLRIINGMKVGAG